MTVLIGIAVKGIATAGIINQPFYDFKNIPPHGVARCIWGVLGVGMYVNRRRFIQKFDLI